MVEPKLKSSIWVTAQVKMCDKNSIPIFVLKKGDPDAGSILLKINRLELGIEIYNQSRTSDGKLTWISASTQNVFSEQAASDYINKQCTIDPDIWILEIEDSKNQLRIEQILV